VEPQYVPDAIVVDIDLDVKDIDIRTVFHKASRKVGAEAPG
jgi:hypothetical protein